MNFPDNYVEKEVYSDTIFEMTCERFNTDNPSIDQLAEVEDEFISKLEEHEL